MLHQFPAHAGCVTAVECAPAAAPPGPSHPRSFHPREFLLATASADRSARLWDLETWALVAEGARPLFLTLRLRR